MNYPEIGNLIDTEMALQMGAEEKESEQRAMFESHLGSAGKTAGKAQPRATQARKVSEPPPSDLLPGQMSGIDASRAANAQM